MYEYDFKQIFAQFHKVLSTDLVQLRAPSVIRNISFYEATSGVLMRKLQEVQYEVAAPLCFTAKAACCETFSLNVWSLHFDIYLSVHRY